MTHLSQPGIGSKVFRFDEVISTNQILHELADHNLASHGAVVISKFQSLGKGQAGRVWESEPAVNILMSILIQPNSIHAEEQVYLNLFSCLSVFDFVKKFVHEEVRIKWPNDIYVNDGKISGILIENSIQGNYIRNCVIGVGVNINQKKFTDPKAVSFSTLNKTEFDIDIMENDILACFDNRYHLFSSGDFESMKQEYLNVMYRKNILSAFQSDGKTFEAEILGINDHGMLELKTTEGIRYFSHNEITFL